MRVKDLTLLPTNGRNSGNVETVESVAWLDKNCNRTSNLYLLLFNVRILLGLTRRQLFPNAILNYDFYNILCVTEAWLVPEVADSELFLNKFVVNKDDWDTTNGRSKNGGAIIAVNASILHARVTLPGYYTDTVAIPVETLDQSFLTVCIYNAPKNSMYRTSLEPMKSLLEKIVHLKHELRCDAVIVIGVINFEPTRWNEMESSELYDAFIVEYLFNARFQQLMKCKKSELDVILTDKLNPIANINVDNRRMK